MALGSLWGALYIDELWLRLRRCLKSVLLLGSRWWQHNNVTLMLKILICVCSFNIVHDGNNAWSLPMMWCLAMVLWWRVVIASRVLKSVGEHTVIKTNLF